jgi:ATP-dependent exoDNAse (exonuclease V) beta subunit
MLDNQNSNKDETLRLLYVAMTRARAKENLTIHLHGNYLSNFNA